MHRPVPRRPDVRDRFAEADMTLSAPGASTGFQSAPSCPIRDPTGRCVRRRQGLKAAASCNRVWGHRMSAEQLAFAIAIAVFAGGSIGLILERVLPEKYTTGAPRDMIGAVVGLLTLLSALVLGLLIWTAYGVYAGQNAAVQGLAAKVLHFDMALADYGPGAEPASGSNCATASARRSTRSGRPTRATPISPPTISPRRCALSESGKPRWPSSTRPPTHRLKRWRRRKPIWNRLGSRGCRCPSPSRRRSAIRWC